MHKITPSAPFIFTTNKRAFTMIELIGAMIIIAVLTVAGISAVSTAIENSRQTAINQDLDGFRKVAEQFLLENPDVSKWNGLNSPQQLKDSFAILNDKYLEGEMKIEPSTQGQSANGTNIWAKTRRLDPYGNPYTVITCTDRLQADAAKDNSYSRIFIRCEGKNGTNTHTD
ncbi:MAG: type II secretion system protein, partial [Clostridia bacterium]